MRLSQIDYLHEGLDRTALKTSLLWENVGRKLVEANLDAATIQKIFTAAEQGAAASGDNRTLLGLGKDAASAVKTAYDDLVSKVQNSGPVQGIDAKYDQAAAKLKTATGGDQGVMQYVEKYRQFAKDHPVAQSLIYSALIAAAGLSGVGAGGAAALGLLKMTDKLLQGEKFSTAVGKGATTGALAYGASEIGDMVRSGQSPNTNIDAGTYAGGDLSKPAYQNAINQVQANTSFTPEYKQAFINALKDEVGYFPSVDPTTVQANIESAREAAQDAAQGMYESINLTNSQLTEVFAAVTVTMVNEGLWDAVKTSVKQKAQQVGQNLTNKVTVDKLNSAWAAAGSPTDSEQVRQVLLKAGVPETVIASVFKQMKISATKATSDVPKLSVKQIVAIVSKLRARDLQSLQRAVDAALASKTKTAP